MSDCRGCGGTCCTGEGSEPCTCEPRSTKPGMAAVYRALVAPLDQAQVCYWIAVELRAEINGLWASQHGAVSGRPGKREIDRREARIEGMKWALALALGVGATGGWQEKVNAFLDDFRQERLRNKQKGGA